MGRPLRDALDALAARAQRGAPAGAKPPEPRWLRAIERDDRDLFDLIFEIQDRSYRRNRFIGDRVWTYETFRERSAGYVLFGRLPRRAPSGHLPPVGEALEQRVGFVFGRLLPARARRPWLKLSGMAGHPDGILEGCGDALAWGLPTVAAVEPRLARVATRAGFHVLSPRLARWVLPVAARAFIQPPWVYHGVGADGALHVTHPQFRDPSTGAQVTYAKMVVLSPGALGRSLRFVLPHEILNREAVGWLWPVDRDITQEQNGP